MEKDKFDYYIKTEKNNWEVVIGLEVHAQVISRFKIIFRIINKIWWQT